MPAQSQAQLRWVKSGAGRRALGPAGQREWISTTPAGGRNLPERISERRAYGSKPVTRST